MSDQIPPPTPLQYATPLRGNPPLRAIGLAQRQLVWGILASALQALGVLIRIRTTPSSPALLGLAIFFLLLLVELILPIFMAVCSYRMAAALGHGAAMRLLFAFGMIIPLGSLFLLLNINQKATHMLESNGIRVGLLGARLADLQQG
jgi:hypothetical protein